MKYLSKHLLPLAYFLTAHVLFQSCVAYNKTPATINEALEYNGKVKIFTTDDKVYKLNWMIIKDKKVFSVLNTEKVSLNRSEIQIHKPLNITLDSALNHNGTLYLSTTDDKSLTKYFRLIEADNGQLFGIKMLNEEAFKIFIPENKIAKVVLEDKKLSRDNTIATVTFIVGSIVTIVIVAVNSMDFL